VEDQDESAGWFSGGIKTPSISWRNKPIGTTVTGKIARASKIVQQRDVDTGDLLWWDEQKTQPRKQLVVYLNTGVIDPEIEDHDGTWALYVKGKSMTDALNRAVVVEAKAKALAIGGTLTVKFIGEGTPTKKAFNPPKFYELHYEPPADASGSFVKSGAGGRANDEPPF
jgi:hypothetical protein